VNNLLELVDQHRYQDLFIEELNWHRPDQHPIKILTDAGSLTAYNISSYKGLRVWTCNALPGTAAEAEVDRAIAKTTTDRLIIFHEGDKQIWRWPVRRSTDTSVQTRLARHRYSSDTPNPSFDARIRSLELPLEASLSVTDVLVKVRSAFDVESHRETRHASKLMARLYGALEKAYPNSYSPSQRDHEIATCLARILFLVFGDDTEMWEPDAFRDYLRHHTRPDATDLAARLNELFIRLDTPGSPPSHSEFSGFKYVNGGLFTDPFTIPEAVSTDFRQALMDACVLDWSNISPAIFGSMFQSVRDADTRRSLGEHYTSEENILKTLNPLFLDELRTDYSAALGRDTTRKQINALEALWKRLGDIRFMDPACGCGNFIIVAYRELRDLELNVMDSLRDLRGEDQHTLPGDMVRALRVTLDHFYGIEIDEWPAMLAQTAMFLIDRQSDLKLRERFGEAPERLPIQCEARIVVANALTADWSAICPAGPTTIVAGNPPFIGARLKNESQASDLALAWGNDYNGDLDYVTGWHAKAVEFYGAGEGRWAFVTTNSITQGRAVAPLFGPLRRLGWEIRFAHRTFPWTSEAAGKAAVHCVIVGFARAVSQPRLYIYDQGDIKPPRETVATAITGYLTDGPWILVEQRRAPLSPSMTKCDFGSMPNDNGNLVVKPDQYPEVAQDAIARKYLREFKGSDELVNSRPRWCLWLENAPRHDLEESPVLRGRVAAVKEVRSRSKRPTTRALASTPHLFGERRQPTTSYLCIPRVVAESRPYFTADRFTSEVVASDAVFTADDPDGFLFGIVSSAMFITWQRAVGGRLKSDPRFSGTLVWNTLPLPLVTPATRTAIIEAGRGVLAVRHELGGSLADLYDAASIHPALMTAHAALDAAVDPAFGASHTCETELERQQVLFARYLELLT
jgi:hypothetical protein